MKKILNHKITKTISIIGLIYIVYILIMILTDKKNLNDLLIWEKIILLISLILPGFGNLYLHNNKLPNLILGISSIVLSFFLGFYLFF